MKEKFKNYLNTDYRFDKSVFLGIIFLIITISGVFGWLYEFIFYYFNSGMKEFYFRGSNFLPWINIYVIGSLFIFFLTYRKRKCPIKVFFFSLIISGIIEYIGGWYMENISDIKYWDYDQEILNFGNINGYVCLRSVLIFGCAGLLLIYVIVPGCFYLARHLRKNTFLIISYTIGFVFVIDVLYNLVFATFFNLPDATTIYKKLGFKYLYFK